MFSLKLETRPGSEVGAILGLTTEDSEFGFWNIAGHELRLLMRFT